MATYKVSKKQLDKVINQYNKTQKEIKVHQAEIKKIEGILADIQKHDGKNMTAIYGFKKRLDAEVILLNTYKQDAAYLYNQIKNMSKGKSSGSTTLNTRARSKFILKPEKTKQVRKKPPAKKKKEDPFGKEGGKISKVSLSWGAGQSFLLPISPQEVEVKTAATFAKHTIIGLGEIQIPNGSEQVTISWEGIMPVSYEAQQYIVTKDDFKDPNYIIGKMAYFRKNQTKVTLTIEGMLSKTVQLSSFSYKKGGKGDFTYNVEWIVSEETSIENGIKKKRRGGKGKKRPSKAKKNPYPAKKGQTLYSVAKKLFGTGSKWKTLYKKNKKALKKAGIKKKKTKKFKKTIKLKW